MTGPSTYEFVFRGLLAEEALDRAGRKRRDVSGVLDADVADKLSIQLLDDELVATARRMATVYTAIAAFENSVRDLVSSTMIEAKGDDWWLSVKAEIRNRAETRQENEEKHRFHSQRGDQPLNYTELKDLLTSFELIGKRSSPSSPVLTGLTVCSMQSNARGT